MDDRHEITVLQNPVTEDRCNRCDRIEAVVTCYDWNPDNKGIIKLCASCLVDRLTVIEVIKERLGRQKETMKTC